MELTPDEKERLNYFQTEYALSTHEDKNLEWMWHAVNARRLSWDSLLWQIPLLFVTGEAFLFIIILNDATSYFARNLSSILAIVVSFASLQVFSRYRASEMHDAELLAAIEMKIFAHSLHGSKFRDTRNEYVKKKFKREIKVNKPEDSSESHNTSRLGKILKTFNLKLVNFYNRRVNYLTFKLNSYGSFNVWVFMYLIFFAFSVACLVLNIFDEGLFHSVHDFRSV